MKTVIVADDDADVRRLVARFLKRLGYACVEASSEEELRAACAKIEPAAVICDVELGSDDGVAACLKLLSEHGPLPVVIISGNPDALRRAKESGFKEALQKPFFLGDFNQSLQRGFRGVGNE